MAVVLVGVASGGKPSQVVLGELVQDAVVEQDVRAVQTGDDHVLVVAGVAEQRPVGAITVRHPWHVLVHAAGAELQLRPHRPIRVLDVQLGPHAGPTAEHRVQIECWGARVGRQRRVLRDPELRGLIERDVVIDALPHERRPRGHRRVIRIGPVRIRRGRVAVHARVDDQRLRAGRQLIAGVHDPARPAASSSAARTVSFASENGGR